MKVTLLAIRPAAGRADLFVALRVALLAPLLVFLLAVQALPAAAQAARAKVNLRCDAVAIGPTLDCVVQLAARDGKPLDGAQVMLGASMPSMPMAHRVKPTVAAPTGEPGEYRGRLELEMSGVWALQIDIHGPLRDRAVMRLQAEECPEGQKRCAVRPAGKP